MIIASGLYLSMNGTISTFPISRFTICKHQCTVLHGCKIYKINGMLM